jgi:hypothetical protein
VPENKEPGPSHEDEKVQKLMERVRKEQAPNESSIISLRAAALLHSLAQFPLACGSVVGGRMRRW